MPLTNWELRYATHRPIHAAELCRRLCGLSALQRGVVVSQAAVEALMARFKLELAQTVIERATVWLEANNADEAEKLALKESTIGLADWRFKDGIGDIEVIGVEELK
jgi:hypothetical protein